MTSLPQTLLSRRFSLRGPLILAPMAGGPSTPELVAAVGNAGGLGFLGGAYLSPELLEAQIQRTRALSNAAFGVNLFLPQPALPLTGGEVAAAVAATAAYRHELGLAPPAAPAARDEFERQFEVVARLRPAVFSFTFGVLDRRYVDACRERGIVTIGGATTLEEALALEAAGIDAVVAQGAEAGGHRFVFDANKPDALIGTLALVRVLARSLHIPVIAAGGIMDGAGIAAALTLGAQAAQLGTAFLACPEAGTSTTYRRALIERPSRPTVITRAFSGRPARALINRFTVEMTGKPVLPFPFQNGLTREIRQEAGQRGDAELLSLWAGQGIALIRSLPAGELVSALFEELAKATGPTTPALPNTKPATEQPFTPTIIPGLRSPYDQVAGVVHFPRMIDKIRLHHAGRLPQAWVDAMGSARGLDGACCTFLGIDYPTFRAHVEATSDAPDDTLLEWAFQHGRRPAAEEIRTWSETLMRRGWRDAVAERVRIRLKEAGLPEDAAKTMFDFIEIDEGRPPRAKLG